jgi:UDP-N-acetylglucosamine--N-acetylmuramyl-(pentapeptide) pyrophosphoryl-undecaprenol N-acetylglucosamine transferase
MKIPVKKNLIITGGHFSPAWATIHELQKKSHWQIFYLGRQTSSSHTPNPSDESQLIPTLPQVKFIPLTTGRLPHKLTFHSLIDLLKLPLGFLQSLYLLLKLKPHLVLSFGGYLSLPVIFNAWYLRIPTIIHEQTTSVGFANQIASRFAARIAVSFKSSLKHFPPKKTTLTGNPLRPEIFKSNPSYLNKLKNLTPRPIIYITGGNQGARDLNLPVIQSLPQLLKTYSIIHQVGDHQLQHHSWQQINQIQKSHPQLAKYYLAQDYFSPDQIGTIFSLANLIISRSGANITTELAALGKPAILIPLPTSHHQEQLKNAKILAQTDLAEIIEEQNLSSTSLINLINHMSTNLKTYQSHAPQAKKLINPHAAQELVTLIEQVTKSNSLTLNNLRG